MVDTTCGSVLNVWKNVRRYAQDGFTSIIHGKYWHEETQATASQATALPGGRYLVVYDKAEAALVCDYIRGRRRLGGLARDVPRRGLARVRSGRSTSAHVGLANQTTMLMSESLEIGDMFRDAMRDRYGETELASRYRAFDTICSATQDRQDAVIQLLAAEPLDLMVVIGGYNSSNTCNLAHICAEQVPTFHIAEPDVPGLARRRSGTSRSAARTRSTATGWLPSGGAVRVGLTSGASTPDNLVEQVIERLDAFANSPASSRASTDYADLTDWDPLPAPDLE